MEPIVNGLERDYGAQIAFDKVDANMETGRMLLRHYGLRGHPSYVIVDPQGNRLWSASGVITQAILQETIAGFVN